MTLSALSGQSLADWNKAAAAAQKRLETRLYIDGKYVDALDGGRFENVNPATGEVIGAYAAGNAKDIDRAVAAARHAHRTRAWLGMAPRERMDVLFRWTALIEEHAADLAVLETLDMGKPISDVLAVDLPAVLRTIQFMAEAVDKINGYVTNTRRDVMHYCVRDPLGVVGAISPWNYPMLMGVWKVAPALAAGNCVVLKPAEQAPSTCLKLAELFTAAGGPAGVFNVVNGLGEEAGKALALHNDVAKISFTGSTEVGKLMLQYSGQSNMKHVGLECGGKSPQIFMGDLPDMEQAVAAAFNGIYSNMGEVCNAGSRLLVDATIHDEFVERFIARGRSAYQAGNPLDPATNLGPLVTRESQQRVLRLVEAGKREGARLEFGGDVPSQFPQGAFVNPTLFTGVRNDMTIARQEVFGPVASVIRFSSVEEAIAIANDSVYGLAAGVWTRDLDRAHRFIREVEAGIIWVNCFDDGDMTQPFGGYKQSGNTRDKCLDSLISYTQIKSAWIQLRGQA